MRHIIIGLAIFFGLVGFYTQAKSSQNNARSQQTDINQNKGYPHSNAKIANLLRRYRSIGKLDKYLAGSQRDSYAQNMISWQLPTGGFGIQNEKAYLQPWDGKHKRSQWVSDGVEHGNFDDDATVAEIRYLAHAYQQTEDLVLKKAIKESVAKVIQFIFDAQHPSGGWPQVYPKLTNSKGLYSNHITLNDDAMIRVMVLLSDISAALPPFNNDIISTDTLAKIHPKLTAAVDFLLKAQIKSQGKLTIWAAQHNPITYQPEAGRKYEPIARAAQESAGVLVYLMNWPEQTKEALQAVQAGIAWYQNNLVSNLWQNKKTGKFEFKQGKRLWYRFYEIEQDTPFFCGRDGIKKYDFYEIEWERRTGYGWGGDYAGHLLKAAKYYESAQLQ